MVFTKLFLASRLLNAHRLLLKTLLRGLLPFVRSQGTRRLSSASEGLPIPALLKSILLDPKKFGSAVVSLGMLKRKKEKRRTVYLFNIQVCP